MPEGTIDQRYATKTERPLDPSFIETERRGRDNITTHIVRASRLIVLSQDEGARFENSVTVAKGEHLLVYGDRVRVAGRIELRGLDLTINCRELELAPVGLQSPEIDVSGANGAEPDPGLNTVPPEQATAGTKQDRKGKDGTPGSVGSGGKSGEKGGTISIACETLKSLALTTLKTHGGKGGAGVRGQDGGQGGNGLNSDDVDTAGKFAGLAVGGAGGVGGNGGDGGDGGKGGRIELYCRNMLPASHLALSVVGGDGGKGGAAGKGGAGGNGGKPADGSMQAVPGGGFFGHHRCQDGADSGAGGPPGVAGWGGGCGDPGTIRLLSGAKEEKTVSLHLICKSGRLGERGVSASWGAAGEPGQPAGRGDYAGAAPGNTGKRPDPDLKRTVTRSAPVKQGPVQRTWEDWQDVPPKTPTPLAVPTAPISPGPEPRQPKAKDIPEIYLKDPQRWRGQLQAIQKENELRIKEFNEEHQHWARAQRKYEQEQHTHKEAIEEENSLHSIWQPAELKDIVARQDTEQLQMLYDFVRARCLLAPNGRALEVPHLSRQLAWLVVASYAKLDREKVTTGGIEEEKVLDTPATVFQLWQAACATNANLWYGNNLFGHNARYAVLGDPEKQVEALQKMRTNLKDIEDFYQQNVRFLNLAKSWATNWGQVKHATEIVKNEMEEKQTTIREALGEALFAIEQKESIRKELLDQLVGASMEFEEEIKGKTGLTPQDIFGMLNQLSFTNREFHDQAGKFLIGGAVAAGGMLVSQAGELIAKALDNVVTDTGESVNKKYIIRNVKTLTAKLPTIENLKQERSGLLSQDPNAEVRLLATREQLNSILENFYEQSEKARKISKTLDAYVDAVQARNAKVDEWNQLLALYAYCDAESKKAEAQSAEVDKTKSNDPGLVAMARFSTALNRHALEDYIKRLYESGRVLTLRTLRTFDPFANLSKIDSESDSDIGFLNSAILASAVNDYIGEVLSSNTTVSDPSDMPEIELTLTAKTHPLVLGMLRQGKMAQFEVPAPDPRAVLPGANPPADKEEPPGKPNVFALMADVRLTHIKPHVFLDENNELSSLCSKYTVQLSHSGQETFYRADGAKILLNHDPMEKSFPSEDAGKPKEGVLSGEHSGMIGPFSTWVISIPESGIVYKPGTKEEDKNLKKIESIKIVFQGKYRGFTPAAIETAKKESRAIVTEVIDKTFQLLVLKAEKPIVVDFWSKRDGSSPALELMRREVKRSYAGQVRFAKYNVDENKTNYELYKTTITKVPSLLLFRGGDLLQVADGSLPADQIGSTLRTVIGQPSAELGAGAGAGA